MDVRKHLEVVCEFFSPAGRRVADVGCGDGGLVRALTRRGAEVIGIDTETAALERARSAEPAGGERYVIARGEALPLAERSCDIVVYFNSLHHVEPPRQPAALREAARVLRPGGLLYVLEPVAAGACFDLSRAVVDETEVRAAAYRALAAPPPELHPVRELAYLYPVRFADFGEFERRLLSVDPGRADTLAHHRTEVARDFERLADRTGNGYNFLQPSRVNLLRRAS